MDFWRRRLAISAKHNARLSGAEGGCQAEVGIGSSMGAAMIAQALGAKPKVVSNAAESALEHHLGMRCDPVAGYVQIPCIEHCAYAAVKAWTAYCIANEESPRQRRVDLDTTIAAMALTAKEINAKYKETSEGGLAVSLGALLRGATTLETKIHYQMVFAPMLVGVAVATGLFLFERNRTRNECIASTCDTGGVSESAHRNGKI
jgi:hypothetical protein